MGALRNAGHVGISQGALSVIYKVLNDAQFQDLFAQGHLSASYSAVMEKEKAMYGTLYHQKTHHDRTFHVRKSLKHAVEELLGGKKLGECLDVDGKQQERKDDEGVT